VALDWQKIDFWHVKTRSLFLKDYL